MTIRVGDVKRWDIFTISEEIAEQRAGVKKAADSLPEVQAEYLYEIVDYLDELSLELLDAAQRGGEVMMGEV